MKLDIVTGRDNPILRNSNTYIKHITPELKKLIEEMFRAMKQVDGIGLAAPQIGENIQLFVVDELAFDPERSKWEFKKILPPDVSRGFAFVNPKVSSFPRVNDIMEEGCLSLPGWEGLLTRSRRLTIKAEDREGRIFKLQAKGLLARVLQHEYDHLQGTLICDKWENEKRIKKQELRIKGASQKSKIKNIVFFGGSEYSKIVLDKLRNTPYEPSLIIEKATNYKLQTTSYLLGITAAYGSIIPKNIIEKFKYGILNIHPSLLPKYRGPSPLQETIINGDKTAGVSIIQLTSKMDAGPVVAQREFAVSKKYTSGELGDALFKIGGEMLTEALPMYMKSAAVLLSQDESKASYTKRIKKEDALIDWSEDAEIIERKIRAYQSWPACYTFFTHRGKKMRLQILEADGIEEKGERGVVKQKNSKMMVHCGKGSLLVKKLRPEGKRLMSGEEFLRGYEAVVFFSQTKEA